MSVLSTVVTSRYFKSIITAAFCFLAAVLGILAGQRILGVTSPPEQKYTVAGSDIPRMNLVAGDLFPLEPFTDLEGRTGNFRELLADSEALVIMASTDCEKCLDLVQFYRSQLRSRLRPGVKVIVCLTNDTKRIPAEYAGLFEGMTVVFYDRVHWEQMYHQVFWPVLVGVDNSGFIVYSQYGFDNSIDYQLANRFLAKAD